MVDRNLPTLGYSVDFLDSNNVWKTIFDANSNPDALSIIVNGLTKPKLYQFRAYSVNLKSKTKQNLFNILKWSASQI